MQPQHQQHNEPDTTDDGTVIPQHAFVSVKTPRAWFHTACPGCGFTSEWLAVVSWHMNRCPHVEVSA